MATVEIDDHSDEYMKDVDKALEKALTAIGIHLEGEAKEELENTPRRIDTGLLRNSITYALDGEAAAQTSYSADDGSKSGSYSGTAPKDEQRSVMVGTNVEYALYVHEGTQKTEANRFLKNALDRNREQCSDYVKKALENGS